MDQGMLESAYERFSKAMAAGDLAALETATSRRYFQDFRNTCSQQGMDEAAASQMLQRVSQMIPSLSMVDSHDAVIEGSRGAIWGAGPDPDTGKGCMALYFRFVDEGDGAVYDDAFFYQTDEEIDGGMTWEKLQEHLPDDYGLDVDRPVPDPM